MQNQKLWINAQIGLMQAELELVRQSNLSSRNAENSEETRKRLDVLLSNYKIQLGFRPFTNEMETGITGQPEC